MPTEYSLLSRYYDSCLGNMKEHISKFVGHSLESAWRETYIFNYINQRTNINTSELRKYKKNKVNSKK